MTSKEDWRQIMGLMADELNVKNVKIVWEEKEKSVGEFNYSNTTKKLDVFKHIKE